jgi:hypothetical protein
MEQVEKEVEIIKNVKEEKEMSEKAQEQKENEKKEENMNENTEKDTKQEENLKLWSLVEKTDPKYTKLVSYGQRRFTTIVAYYQIKMATKIWGSYGSTWGLKDSELEITKIGNTDMAIYKAIFYYPKGSFEIRNSIKIADDEFLKKLETDTITKSLSRLGFNADVFMGRFDDSRYVESLRNEFQSTNSQQPQTSQQQSVPNTPKPDQPQKSQKQSQNVTNDLESLGITIKTEGNLLIADGDTFNNKSILKANGFAWDSGLKKWIKKIA